MENQKLLLNAESFGFGPTAAIADFFYILRKKFRFLAYIGAKHTIDLQKNLKYDEIIDSTNYSKDDFLNVLNKYDLFCTACDIENAKIAISVNMPTIFYDPLLWYWPKKILTIASNPNTLYLAQNFHGVSEAISNHLALNRVQVVPPLVNGSYITNINKKNLILVNLGGLSNPYWTDADVLCYATSIISAIRTTVNGRMDLIFCVNQKIASFLNMEDVKNISRNQINKLLYSVKYAIVTPGLSNIYDLASFNIPSLYLPPTNNSQGRQMEMMTESGMIDVTIDWVDLGYPKINYLLPHSLTLPEISANVRLWNKNLLVKVFSPKIEHLLQLTDSKSVELISRFGKGGINVIVEKILTFTHVFCLPKQLNVLRLPADLTIHIYSSNKFKNDFSSEEIVRLSSHLPDVVYSNTLEVRSKSNILSVECIYSDKVNLIQKKNHYYISGPSWPNEDSVHFLNGIVRLAYLRQGMSLIHAACIGNDQIGYVLLAGPSGAGKTSTIIYAMNKRNLQVFSADSTILAFDSSENNVIKLFGLGGTKVISSRLSDLKGNEQDITYFGDRGIYPIPQNFMSQSKKVLIKGIILMKLNEQESKTVCASHHRIFPFFLHTERENVLLGGSNAILNGEVSSKVKLSLGQKLERIVNTMTVLEINGSKDDICDSVEKMLFSNIKQTISI